MAEIPVSNHYTRFLAWKATPEALRECQADVEGSFCTLKLDVALLCRYVETHADEDSWEPDTCILRDWPLSEQAALLKDYLLSGIPRT